MDGITTCDLLKGQSDVHPTIAHYILTPLDVAVNERTIKDYQCCNPGLPAVLMRYWDKYRAQMLEIFEDSFPEDYVQRWINRDVFKHDMLMGMADTLFDWLFDEGYRELGRGEFMEVDFAGTLGIPLHSKMMSCDAASHAIDRTSICLTVNTALIDDFLAKNI